MELQDGLSLTLGGTTLALLVKEGFAWLRARRQRTEIAPSPLPVDKLDKFVTRGEFNKHVEDNARDHENMFARLNANDKLTSKLEGVLEGIREDLKAIKDKLFRRTK
ncbi:MAG: hypothetical protein IJG84_03950 [Kiritimatiellae bacterium]|nr:hypothetical protein [Kiritimatiellia bacterium]